MRATITRSGTLKIIPQTELEAYALHCFAEQWRSGNPFQPALHFCTDWPAVDEIPEVQQC